MRLAVAACLLIFTYSQAHATAQFSDIIVIEDEELALFSNPLEQHFSRGERPQFLLEGVSTANWRGYVATWTIEAGKLYLLKIEKEYATGTGPTRGYEWRTIPLQTFFPKSGDRIFAEWFTGELQIPKGNQLRYVHMGYSSIYERELRIGVENGVVKSTKEITNTLDSDFDACIAAVEQIRSMTAGGGNDPAIGVTDPVALQRIAELEEVCKEFENSKQ